MEISILPNMKNQLLDRKKRLQEAIQDYGEKGNLVNLLIEVDNALERVADGTYGLCEVCHDPIEEDLLLADPLTRFCIDHLNPVEQKFLEQDLELASKIQTSLLPKKNLQIDGWEISYIYQPAGPVSGDYCDIVKLKDGTQDFYFILGDVSGKGIAASMLMTQIHAMVHSLLTSNLPVDKLMEKINRLFSESSLSSHFATLVIGKVSETGYVEICNAGHCPLVLIQEKQTTKINATGIPIGLFCSSKYEITVVNLNKGDILFIYTDGLNETIVDECEYGLERVSELASDLYGYSSNEVLNTYLNDLNNFIGGTNRVDDLTLLAVRRK